MTAPTTTAQDAPARLDDRPHAIPRCLICGTKSELPECVPCSVAEETLWKRLVDA
jgi:hypothetical protein